MTAIYESEDPERLGLLFSNEREKSFSVSRQDSGENIATPCEGPTNSRVEEGQNGKCPSLPHEEWGLLRVSSVALLEQGHASRRGKAGEAEAAFLSLQN